MSSILAQGNRYFNGLLKGKGTRQQHGTPRKVPVTLPSHKKTQLRGGTVPPLAGARTLRINEASRPKPLETTPPFPDLAGGSEAQPGSMKRVAPQTNLLRHSQGDGISVQAVSGIVAHGALPVRFTA
ncbi:hypothetical protein [Variovorax rhizosphaerae]|uniref:Uncharacterized protein n=1 Tax=Variovorax rhizosphaerae TaxID=1836200 RepID=A0ABU8WZB0_9BURK